MKRVCAGLPVLMLFAGLTLSPLLAGDQTGAGALLIRALELSDIRCEGCPPFQMKISFVTHAPLGEASGSYHLRWQSPMRWAEEVEFEAVKEARVRIGETVWVDRNTRFRPYVFYLLEQVLAFPARLRAGINQRAEKITEREVSGMACHCVSYSQVGPWPQEFCILPDKGLLIRDQESEYVLLIDTYPSVDSKLFPRRLRAYSFTEAILEVTVEEVEVEVSPETWAIRPLVGIGVRQTCAQPRPARVRRAPRSGLARLRPPCIS